MSHRDPLPVDAVRDLLGICRAWYAAAKRDHGTSKPHIDELTEIGRKLRLALKLARSAPDTLGHRAAWLHAEEATARLMKLVMALPMPAAPIVEAAVIRFRARPRTKPSERDERRITERFRR